VKLRRAEIALHGVDEIGVKRQAVEVPRSVRVLLDTGELAPGVVRKVGRFGEIVVGLRKVQPQRLARRVQLVGGEKALDEGEPLVADLIESGVRNPHGSAP